MAEEVGAGLIVGERYELLRRIGQGGMGQVWEARHVKIGRRVALKFLNAHLGFDADAVARFKREAKIAGSIGHDNICPVQDVGIGPNGEHYLVMELLRGKTLRDELEANGSLAFDRALDIVGQVLGALGAAHSAGIVHRDMKPENVFLSRIGERDDFVRVLDFGISKVVGGAVTASPLTQTGGVLGTPYYMAPEQARGSRDQDARVDIYAAGVLLYELVTGRRPYEADNLHALILKIVMEPFQVPRAHNPDVPPEVEEIILRAMARDRSGRYGSADEMRQCIATVRARGFLKPSVSKQAITLATAISGLTPFSTSMPTVQNEGAPRRSRRGTVVAALLLLGAAATVVVWGSILGVQAPQPAAAPLATPAVEQLPAPQPPPPRALEAAHALASPGAAPPPQPVVQPDSASAGGTVAGHEVVPEKGRTVPTPLKQPRRQRRTRVNPAPAAAEDDVDIVR